MSLGEAVRSALWSLRSNKLRSFLSMLGIIIGVAAVVGIVSIGLGAQSQVLDMVSALGSNLIMITPAPTLGRSGRMSSDAVDVFTMEMAQHLQEMAPSLTLVVPQVQSSGLLLYAGANLRATLVGTTPQYTQVTNYEVAAGRFLHALDLEQRTPVLVLGSRLAERLFGEVDPVGQVVRLVVGNRRYDFVVVGVMAPQGTSGAGELRQPGVSAHHLRFGAAAAHQSGGNPHGPGPFRGSGPAGGAGGGVFPVLQAWHHR